MTLSPPTSTRDRILPQGKGSGGNDQQKCRRVQNAETRTDHDHRAQKADDNGAPPANSHVFLQKKRRP